MTGRYTSEILEEKIESIPLIDTAAFEILSLLNNPASNYARIVDNLSPDIAARFLNLANKAHYGRVVRSIGSAVALLGYQNMRQIIVTSFLLDHFTKRLGLKDFSFDFFKKQARFSSIISRFLAEMMHYKNPDDIFTVSMLSNIGKLIIAVYFSEDHREIAALQKEKGITASDAERMVLGVSHADISAFALKRFNIPQDICDAVRYHDLIERDIPQGSNFQLEIIARKSAMIVHQFSLPDEVQLKKLSGQLSKTVSDGKLIYREMVAGGSNPEKDQESYTTLADWTTELLSDRLKEVWHPRNQQESTD